MADVVLDRVTKRFGEVVAVNNLSIEIRNEEFLVLVGPSGCGKSTALRMIAGLEEITAGDLFIGGKRVNDVPPKSRDIAMVFQSYALYPHMSVYENMAFGLKLRKTAKHEIDRRVRETAGLLGIEALLGRWPRQLSGGQRQRVALGRAIVREPHVFLMDEPLSNLDAKLRVQTRAELIKLHQRLRRTTIYVTHDQVEAMTMGERIAVMRDGKLQQLDTPRALYETPANRFVAEFIGSPAMNIFEGVVDGDMVAGDGLRVPISPALRSRINGRTGPILFGIRPEHLTDPREQPGADLPKVRAHANVVETLGAEALITATAGGAEFLARVEGRYAPRPGEEIDLVIAADSLHLFDPATERALG